MVNALVGKPTLLGATYNLCLFMGAYVAYAGGEGVKEGVRFYLPLKLAFSECKFTKFSSFSTPFYQISALGSR